MQIHRVAVIEIDINFLISATPPSLGFQTFLYAYMTNITLQMNIAFFLILDANQFVVRTSYLLFIKLLTVDNNWRSFRKSLSEQMKGLVQKWHK